MFCAVKGACIIDAALLIESGLHTVCDEVWLITAPEEIRCARIMKRDGLSEQQAWQRIKSQMPETQKKSTQTACWIAWRESTA
ncbi:MAG: dephospho-CoA kinase [Christensenellales bacterium]